MRAHLILVALLLSSAVPAQFDNPEKKIQEIVDQVAEQMQEIDELLLKARPDSLKGAAEGAAQAAEKIEELLDQTTKSQGEVVTKIDELIKVIQQMKGQGGGQGQPQPKQEQGEQQRRGPQRRNQSQTPDMQNQGKPQDGEQPQDGPERPGDAQNKASNPRPEDPTENVDPQRDTESWGSLPLYEQLLKTRGGAPEVPQKYRKFHEAFLRSQSPKRKPGR